MLQNKKDYSKIYTPVYTLSLKVRLEYHSYRTMKFRVYFLHVFHRKYLKSGSGFESLQFRLIENRFGLQQVRCRS